MTAKQSNCSKCGSNKAVSGLPISVWSTGVQGSVQSRVTVAKAKKSWFSSEDRIDIGYRAAVCTDCGHTELTADGDLKGLLRAIGVDV
jgi:hypothetical protein